MGKLCHPFRAIPKSKQLFSTDVFPMSRVAKCHGYGGYIRVKELEDWGKKSGRIYTFAKLGIVLGKFVQVM